MTEQNSQDLPITETGRRHSRVTQVQKDVIARLQDGWQLRGAWCIAHSGRHQFWQLRKPGEPDRHVAASTVEALVNREAIGLERDGIWNWIGRLV